ncbi:MAG: hypothetical protein KF795_31850 [Labilithrix sp.]|nr:hypothetical protein [Labilithrix sp.]
MRAALLSVALCLLSPEAFALEDDVDRIVFDYSAAAECPSDDELLRQIASYTTKWTLAQPEEAARRFVVRIARRGDRYEGRLDLLGAGGDSARRELKADDCADVVLGLAIAIAIAIDPHAALGRETPAANVPDARTTADPPEPDVPAPAPPTTPAERPKRPAPKPARVDRLAPSIGARTEANSAVSGLLAVVNVYVEAEWSAPIARLPSLRPVLRVGFRKSFTRTSRVGETEADIDWSAGQIEACPTRFLVTAHLSMEVCLGSNAGVLSAEARTIPGAGVTQRFWFDYGAVVAARWQIHPNVFVEAVGAGWLPFTRDRLRVEPDGVVTEAPAIGFSGGIGTGWRF